MMKATIVRDLSLAVETTNKQKTISLKQARLMNQRPPELLMTKTTTAAAGATGVDADAAADALTAAAGAAEAPSDRKTSVDEEHHEHEHEHGHDQDLDHGREHDQGLMIRGLSFDKQKATGTSGITTAATTESFDETTTTATNRLGDIDTGPTSLMMSDPLTGSP